MVSASAQEVPDPEFQAAWSEPVAREAFRHSAGLRIAEHLYQARTRVLSLAVLQITWQLRKCRPLPTPSSTPGPLTPQVYSGASAGAFCGGPVLKRRDEQKGARPEAGLAQGENPRTRNTEQTSPGRDRRAGTRRQRRGLTAASPAVAPPPHTAEGSVHSPGMGRILHPR